MQKSCKTKAQPWKSQWPSSCETIEKSRIATSRPSHGFLAGEEVVMDGNTLDRSQPTAMAKAAPSVQELFVGVSRKVFETDPTSSRSLEADYTRSWVQYGVMVGVLLCALIIALMQWERLRKFLA
jgi:hypothetical protein